MTGSRRAARRRGVLYYIGLGLSAGLLAFLALIGALVILIPAVSGSTPMTILTGSMQPTYPPGTLIIVQPIDAESIVIGDPITYQIESGKPEVITHRVIEVRSESNGSTSFITKGDNNDEADPKPVIPDQVKGTVWYSVPLIGYLATALNGQSRSWLVPVVAVGLLAYAAIMIVSALVARARKRAGRESGRRAAK